MTAISTSFCASCAGSARPCRTSTADTNRFAWRSEKYARAWPSASVATNALPIAMPRIVEPEAMRRSEGSPAATRNISIARAPISVPLMSATIGMRRITPPAGSAETSPQPVAAALIASRLASAPAKRSTFNAPARAAPAASCTTNGGARNGMPVGSGIPATASTVGVAAIARASNAS